MSSPYRTTESRRGGLGEPLWLGSMAEETLILQVLKPCPAEGYEILFQSRIDMGFLAVLVIAVNLLHDAEVIVSEIFGLTSQEREGSDSI